MPSNAFFVIIVCMVLIFFLYHIDCVPNVFQVGYFFVECLVLYIVVIHLAGTGYGQYQVVCWNLLPLHCYCDKLKHSNCRLNECAKPSCVTSTQVHVSGYSTGTRECRHNNSM